MRRPAARASWVLASLLAATSCTAPASEPALPERVEADTPSSGHEALDRTPRWGPELDEIVVACRGAHPVPYGTLVSLHTRAIGRTGEIVYAEVRGDLQGTSFANCLVAKARQVGLEPFSAREAELTHSFKLTLTGTNSEF